MDIWSLLTFCSLVVYFTWFGVRKWRLFKGLCHADTARDVLHATLAKKRFSYYQFVSAFMALGALEGLKAGLIVEGKFYLGTFTKLVFGGVSGDSYYQRLGVGAIGLIGVGILSIFEHLKSQHHIEVLYAFRKQLDLKELEGLLPPMNSSDSPVNHGDIQDKKK